MGSRDRHSVEAMKKPKQRLWATFVLIRYFSDFPWIIRWTYTTMPPKPGPKVLKSMRKQYGPRNVRVRRVEVKP